MSHFERFRRFLRRPRALGVLALVASAGAASVALADGKAVAKVGSHLTITVAQVEQLLRQTPPYQLRYLGREHDTIRRAFLQELVRRELLTEAALGSDLLERDDVKARIQQILKDAILDKLRAEAKPDDVSAAEVEAYYAENEDRYAAQQRLKLARITVRTREEAEQVLAELIAAAGKDQPQRWREIAREKSIDQATSKRGGDLDMVDPDGSTANKSLKVDVALYVAALAVKDGEIVAEPVKDGDDWSIVWRRGSYQTPLRALDAEAPVIRRDIAQRKFEAKVAALVQELRGKSLAVYKPELVDALDVDTYGTVAPAGRPDAIPRLKRPAAGSPIPVGPPGGAR
ncbi:MAG: peptidyl-prolyl cis-trans isomerase [Polyangiaceae bacterium]|nr:peptidyl-prolyl cis-trans isomerase [Polyangiaceae bacterium]